MDWIIKLFFPTEFVSLLTQWESHQNSIIFAGVVWLGIVIHLLITGHATLGSNGSSKCIACGDTHVYRFLVIFGGPAGLTFGLPYYMLMNFLSLSGWFRDYWLGFIYIQFATSLVQTIVLLIYMVLVPSENRVTLLKAHLSGCGWVTALSPILWWLYILQVLVRSEGLKWVCYRARDLETVFVFIANFVVGFWLQLTIYVVTLILNSLRSTKLSIILPSISEVDIPRNKHAHAAI